MSQNGSGDSLPFDLEAEKCVLGSILRDPRCLPEVSARLRREDFYSPRHRGLFIVLEKLESRSPGSCDPVVVAHEVERLGQEEKLGGRKFLGELMDAVPSVAFLENHTRIVRDLSLKRALLQAATDIQRDVALGTIPDVTQLINAAEEKVFKVGDRMVGGQMVSAKELISARIDSIMNPGEGEQGLPTGFLDLDEMQSFRPGDLVVLAARPSMGKTALALNILERAALEKDKTILLFSLEMPADQIIMRLLASHSQVRHDALRRGRLDATSRERLTLSAGQISAAKIYIDDSSQPSLAEIRAKARRLIREEGGLDLIIVDYLQLLSLPRVESRQQEISTISRNLKSIARDLQVPVLTLAQLNRAAEKRDSHRPLLSDLRESGAIEQDADMVALLFREDYYNATEENAGVTDLIIAKNRNGPTGNVALRFTRESMRFENLVHVPVTQP